MKQYTILVCTLIAVALVVGCHEDTVNKLLPQLIVYQGSGQVDFRDSKEGLYSDKLVLTLNNATKPPSGSEYEGWLISDGAGGRKVKQTSFGRFNVDSQGKVKYEWISPTKENLLDAYNKVAITVAQIGKPSSSSDRAAFEASLPTGPLVHIRHMDATWETTPGKAGTTGFFISALNQTKGAIIHAGLAANSTTISGVKVHADHVYDWITGKLTGQVPGNISVADNKDPDGYSIIRYVTDGNIHAGLAANSPGATENIKLQASYIHMIAENTMGADRKGGRAKIVADKALEIVTKDYFGDLQEAQADSRELKKLCELLLTGEDLNKDGSIVPPKEGGIITAYEYVQFMARQFLNPVL